MTSIDEAPLFASKGQATAPAEAGSAVVARMVEQFETEGDGAQAPGSPARGAGGGEIRFASLFDMGLPERISAPRDRHRKRDGRARERTAGARSLVPVAPPSPAQRPGRRRTLVLAMVLFAGLLAAGAYVVVGAVGPTPPESAPGSAAKAAMEPTVSVALAPPPAPPPTRPAVDVVRIGNAGASVIAGRAAPGAVLIVLHNGRPIGTARADARGDWVLLPETRLTGTEHVIGIVPMQVQSMVRVPSTLAVAPRKIPPDVVVQLASLKSRARATAELANLKRRFPGLLDRLKLGIGAATVAGRGRVWRIRAEGFAGLDQARKTCARLKASSAGCLVIRRP